MGENDEDDWEEVWDARADALATVLGSGHDNVYHAPHPFSLGGQADVVAFYHHLDGVVYVTAELTGKPDSSYADYELMVCHRTRDEDWGPNVISRLAPYTQEAYIAAGESMDIEALRDHAKEMLIVIADDLARPQSTGTRTRRFGSWPRASPRSS